MLGGFPVKDDCRASSLPELPGFCEVHFNPETPAPSTEWEGEHTSVKRMQRVAAICRDVDGTTEQQLASKFGQGQRLDSSRPGLQGMADATSWRGLRISHRCHVHGLARWALAAKDGPLPDSAADTIRGGSRGRDEMVG
jgi:hypothetical protein